MLLSVIQFGQMTACGRVPRRLRLLAPSLGVVWPGGSNVTVQGVSGMSRNRASHGYRRFDWMSAGGTGSRIRWVGMAVVTLLLVTYAVAFPPLPTPPAY